MCVCEPFVWENQDPISVPTLQHRGAAGSSVLFLTLHVFPI